MKLFKPHTTIILCAILYSMGCTYDQNPEPPLPPSSEETEELEVIYRQFGPNTINDAYWSTADYIHIDPVEISKGSVLNENGLLNMTGLFDGLPAFNDGDSAAIRIKAAYDDVNLYILAEWVDQSYDISQANWVYNGDADPLKPAEDPSGWTSQFNDDKLILSFDMGNGSQDIWKWSFAISEPLGYAIDMVDDGSGASTDAGDILVERNTNGVDHRSGPAYEWDGVDQEIDRPLADGSTFLDPAFFLLNKTDFTGDVLAGETLYQAECSICHGVKGDGDGTDWQTWVSMREPAYNRVSRGALDNLLGAAEHSGRSHWIKLDDQEKRDLTARLRSFSGIPGYYLDTENLSPPDVKAVSAEIMGRIDYNTRDKTNYKVLLVRPLITDKPDDVQFDPERAEGYSFDVMVTDNDDPNRVGEMSKILIFK